MIGHIQGTVARIGDIWMCIDVHGVGYVVFTTAHVLSTYRTGASVMVYTYTHVTEQAFDLFGFESEGDLQLYKMLISVSGVGPKTGLAMMNGGAAEAIVGAIARGDVTFLTKVPGIGKKTAERIIVELKDKVGGVGLQGTTTNITLSFVVDALISMGYRELEAQEAVKHLDSTGKSEQDLVREALSMVSRH